MKKDQDLGAQGATEDGSAGSIASDELPHAECDQCGLKQSEWELPLVVGATCPRHYLDDDSCDGAIRLIGTCTHCGEDIRQDDDGEWMDRETFHSCDLEPPAPKHAPCGHGWHWGAKCDEPAKPEAGPMRNTESPSGVQALGSSGLALARAIIVDLRDAARNIESSTRGDLMWLWRGKAIGYETALGVLDRHIGGSVPSAAQKEVE